MAGEVLPTDPILSRLLKDSKTIDDIAFVERVGFWFRTEGIGHRGRRSVTATMLYDGDLRSLEDQPYLKRQDVRRYRLSGCSHWIRRDSEFTSKIEREGNVTLDTEPYSLGRQKIVWWVLNNRILATLDERGLATDRSLYSIVPKYLRSGTVDLRYLLGLINSQLFSYLYGATPAPASRYWMGKGAYRMERLPVRSADSAEKADKDRHDTLVEAVNLMLSLRSGRPSLRRPDKPLPHQIRQTDRQIDELVYDLYGLTRDEIKIVEGK